MAPISIFLVYFSQFALEKHHFSLGPLVNLPPAVQYTPGTPGMTDEKQGWTGMESIRRSDATSEQQRYFHQIKPKRHPHVDRLIIG
jgi:hypothetical protein